MKIINKGEGIELLNKSLPYPEQMGMFDLDKEGAIYFNWRSARYKLDLDYGRIDKVDGCLLMGDDASLLMTQCIKFNQLALEISKEREYAKSTTVQG